MADPGKKILVLGLGGMGCNTIKQIIQNAPKKMEFAVMDCDVQTLETCQFIKARVNAGMAITDGMSSGGDTETGRRCTEKAVRQLDTLLSGVDLLLVIVGLGGGFGGGAAPVVARIAHASGSRTLFFAVLPFSSEGPAFQEKAQHALRRTRTYADAIVQMPNAAIQPKGDVLFSKSLAYSSQILAFGVIGIWRLLNHTGIYNLDFASLYTMLNSCDASCRFSCATATGEKRSETLIESLRTHPLVASDTVFDEALGMLIGITGGEDLKLSEVQQIIKGVSPKGKTYWLKSGVSMDPIFNGRISVIVLIAEMWTESLIRDEYSEQKSISNDKKQGELAGILTPRSRIFGGAERTIWNGEDLDIPTYIRRNIKLPR